MRKPNVKRETSRTRVRQQQALLHRGRIKRDLHSFQQPRLTPFLYSKRYSTITHNSTLEQTKTPTAYTPMGTAVRVRRENTEHGNDTAASSDEDRDIATTTGEEAHPALADNMPLMPPPPPPAANKADGDTTSQDDVDDNAATETLNNDADMDDETVTIQKVTLADII